MDFSLTASISVPNMREIGVGIHNYSLISSPLGNLKKLFSTQVLDIGFRLNLANFDRGNSLAHPSVKELSGSDNVAILSFNHQCMNNLIHILWGDGIHHRLSDQCRLLMIRTLMPNTRSCTFLKGKLTHWLIILTH